MAKAYDVTVAETITYVVSVYAEDEEYASELAEDIVLGATYVGPYGMTTKGKDTSTIIVERVNDHGFDY